MERSKSFSRSLNGVHSHSRRIVPLGYSPAGRKRAKFGELPELDSYRRIIHEKKQQYQESLKQRELNTAIPDINLSDQEQDSDSWGWFIDPSDIYKYTLGKLQ